MGQYKTLVIFWLVTCIERRFLQFVHKRCVLPFPGFCKALLQGLM